MTEPSEPRETEGYPSSSAYLVQYVRAWRLLQRLERRTAPDFMAAVQAMADYELDLYSFFLMCWHVWDWVNNDDTIPSSVRDAVTSAAFASPVLQVCHDIANGSKHYVLRRPKLPMPGVKPGTIDLERREDGDESTWRFSLVLPDGTSRWAHELAREALRAWDDILRAQRLGTPGTV